MVPPMENINLVSITFSHQPAEAMVLVMIKYKIKYKGFYDIFLCLLALDALSNARVTHQTKDTVTLK